MIKSFEFFHGSVLAQLVHGADHTVSIATFPSPTNSSYIVDGSIGIYIKHSAKRMTPWQFSFTKEHQDEISLMRERLGEVFLLLVCNDDGIVCLSYSELKQVLDDQHAPIEWIRADRHKGQMYAVSGSDGQLNFKIGINDFPDKIWSRTGELAEDAVRTFFEIS